MEKFCYIDLVISCSLNADFVCIWRVFLDLLIRSLKGTSGVLDCYLKNYPNANLQNYVMS